jgi:hypothetical protein
VDGQLDISEYTDKEGQKRMTFGILADTYRLLQPQRGGFKPPLFLLLSRWRIPPTPSYGLTGRNCRPPGGSGNGSLILAHSGGQGMLQLSACQPGQLQRVVGRRKRHPMCVFRAA